MAYLCQGCTPAAAPSPDNLLLITLDTLRPDYLGVYGATVGESPHIDALSRRGLHFSQAYTTAPLTGPAHASILTGRYPSEHGVLYNGMRLKKPMVYNAESTTLSAHLSAQGFFTGAIVTAIPLIKDYGFDQGFDTHQMVPTSNPDIELEYGGSSADALAAARKWIEARGDERFFLWVHLYEAHVPFYSPPEIHARLGSTPGRLGSEDTFTATPAAFRAAYRAEILEVDDAVGGFVAMLEDLKLGDSTVVGLVADHGEYLGEDGLWGHYLVREEVMRIPMMVSGPGISGAVHRGAVSSVDLAPTLLDMMALPPLPGATGRSLAHVDRDSSIPIFGEYRHIRIHDIGKPAQSRDQLLAVWNGNDKMVRSILSMEDRAFATSDTKEVARPITASETSQLSKHLNEFPILNTPVSSAPLPTVSPTGLEMLTMLGYVD
jgi:arylsulfatase A-like enzyme